MNKSRAQLLGTICLLGMALVWGWSFVFQKMALNANLSAAELMFARFFVGACVTGIFGAKQIKANYKKGQWKTGLPLAVLFFAASVAQIVGLGRTTPGVNALITSANVVMVPFLAWAVTRKRPPVLLVVCAAVCFLGIGVLSVEPGTSFAVSPGNLITLFGALMFAAHIVWIGKSAGDTHFAVLTFFQLSFIAAFSLIYLLIDGSDLSGFATREGMISLIYLGVVSTGIGMNLQIIGQKYVPATTAGILVSSEALFGSVFSVLMGYDVMTVKLVIGAGVIFLAILAANISSMKSQ